MPGCAFAELENSEEQLHRVSCTAGHGNRWRNWGFGREGGMGLLVCQADSVKASRLGPY